MAKKNNGPVLVQRIDWLAVAIGNLRGITPAAKALKVSQKTIYAWLDEGLAGLPFAKVIEISEVGDVPLSYLAKRLGPWKGGPPTDPKELLAASKATSGRALAGSPFLSFRSRLPRFQLRRS